ncbi:MAG: type I restriction-modification system subunit M N-terminal domain-containing protein [Candidatus Thermoplasmatota archaeon]|nr:type I restriction-modification system subunit M N-terminal domain-containing protein [Candidatus Thermoplasmatota archaeon]
MANSNDNGATLGFEAKLWQMADKLRNNMDAAEYKHVVLGLIFLKYISDSFEEHHEKLGKEKDQGADPEDPDEYRAFNIFWVPREARWSNLQANAKQPTIGKTVDDAMVAIERDNKTLKAVLPKDYGRPGLDKERLGELIDRVHRELSGDDIKKIADTYHSWRGDKDVEIEFKDEPGFCKSAPLELVRKHEHILTPGRYVGAPPVEDDGEPFEDKMKRLSKQLYEQLEESKDLEEKIVKNLEVLGYGK